THGMAEAFRRVAGPRRRRLRLLQTRGRGQGPRLRSPASRTIAILFRFRARACDGIFAFGVFMKHSRARYIVPLRQPLRRVGVLWPPILFSANLSVAVHVRAFPSAALVLHFPHAKRLSTENRALRIFF